MAYNPVFQAGSTGRTIYIFVSDSGSTPAGQGKTGLDHTTAPSISYARAGAAAVAITPVTQTPTGAWVSGGFCEVDSALQKGLYRLDLPDAAVAAGVGDVDIAWNATGVVDDREHIFLVGFDPETVDPNVAAIKAKTDNLPANPAATTDIPTANANADALLDRTDAVEAGLTFRGALRIALAVLAGKASGMATSTGVFQAAVTSAKPRVTATIDANGNRTAVTTDAT